MWLNLLSLGVKTASHIYQNKQKIKISQFMKKAYMLATDILKRKVLIHLILLVMDYHIQISITLILLQKM